MADATIPLGGRALQLVDRFTFGHSQSLADSIAAFADADAWFEDELAAPADPLTDTLDIWFPRLTGDSPVEQWKTSRAGAYLPWQYANDLIVWSIGRHIMAKSQVAEVMADLWSNLFNIPAGEELSWLWRADFDATVRAHSLGTYADLLRAVVLHPAMSGYLSNFRNLGTAINENLGRELLELYTVGVGAYDEADVRASARMLTGFTLDVFNTWAQSYDPTRHHVGELTVMGQTFANAEPDGRAELDRYLQWLAMRPQTATRVARRLCVRFVADDPPDSIVRAVADAYTDSGSDIKACLRALVKHDDFTASRSAKIRNPYEDVIATVRAIGAQPAGREGLDRISWYCKEVGSKPYTWPAPDGLPERTLGYASPARLLRSWSIHVSLAALTPAAMPATTFSSRTAIRPAGYPLSLTDLVHQQHVLLTGRRAPDAVVKASSLNVNLVNATKPLAQAQVSDEIVELVRGTILNSPGFLRR